MAQLRAEEKEPFAVVELGAATERSIQEGIYSAGPSASVEFPVIKDWLEIETGISPLFRPGQTEWMIWPSADRKFGWFVEPTYSYSFSRGHEQAIGVTTGLTIAIP